MTGPVWQCSCGGYTEMGRYFCGWCGKQFALTGRSAPIVFFRPTSGFGQGRAKDTCLANSSRSSSPSLVPAGGTRRPSPRGAVLRGAFSEVSA
jgi:hypothetical protein